MARTQTLVQLSDELLSALDQRAAKRGVSRSQLVREAVEAYISEDYDAEITRRILEGYRRVPQGGVDDWGDFDAWHDQAAQEIDTALEAEERAAGHEPW